MGQVRGGRGREKTHRLHFTSGGPLVGCLRPQQGDQEAHRLPPVRVPTPPGPQTTSLSLPHQQQDMAFKEPFQKWPLLSLETQVQRGIRGYLLGLTMNGEK